MNRRPSTSHPAAARAFTAARSIGDRPIALRRDFETAIGSDGWLSTGATVVSSSIIPSAKPPVKHMPTAPTPGPPHSVCTCFASARNHSVTGAVLSVASAANSFATHAGIIDCTPYPIDGSRPGVPNSDGSTAVKPSSASRRPKPATFGLMPGISVITTMPGPEPMRNSRVRAPLSGEREAVESFERVGRRFGHGRDHTVRLVP